VNISRGRDVEVHVLIRPRGGNFVYSRSDFDIIVRDILAAKNAGADGNIVYLYMLIHTYIYMYDYRYNMHLPIYSYMYIYIHTYLHDFDIIVTCIPAA
jgi:hypothetical protein